MASIEQFSWVLFDADDTLFHFNAFLGLKHLFAGLNIQFTEHDFVTYQSINKPLWAKYQQGVISAEEIKQRRFALWANQLGCSAQDLEHSFMSIMAKICNPIEGAIELLDALKGMVRLGIITNGFSSLQQPRLEHTGWQDYFDLVVVSEQVGAAKPHQAIFSHALSLMGNPQPEHILMVGDNPDSDILGGLNAGLHTCWFNPQQTEVPQNIRPHFQVASLSELKCVLFGHTPVSA
jgi:putative hydrolase of the HAD superfamily/5'-nucleotidase